MFPLAGGSGTVVDSLSPGEQRVIPDAISWLRVSKGLPIPAGSGQAGTLRLVFTGLSLPEMASARVRTTAASCNGAAGLSYPAWTAGETSTTNLQLFGLRSSSAERTNLAVVNAGTEGSVTLKVVLRAGDGRSTYEVPSSLLPPLSPGEWRQVNDADLLRAAGFTDATALVTRVAGTAPFGAYAVFNDNLSNDGSYVPAVASGIGGESLVLPVVVETTAFESELVLYNPAMVPVAVSLTYVESLARSEGDRSGRSPSTSGRGSRRSSPASSTRSARSACRSGRVAPRRTPGRSPSCSRPRSADRFRAWPARRRPRRGPGRARGRGASVSSTRRSRPRPGRSSRPSSTASSRPRRRDRTSPSSTRRPRTPSRSSTRSGMGRPERKRSRRPPIVLPPLGWTQLDRVLLGAAVTDGYVRIRRTSAGGVFSAYGVLNDGSAPGERTGDGSYVAGVPYYPPD